ncbi:hypothetical protein L510_2339, partial [Bordetella bronchiseptica MBORD591]
MSDPILPRAVAGLRRACAVLAGAALAAGAAQ